MCHSRSSKPEGSLRRQPIRKASANWAGVAPPCIVRQSTWQGRVKQDGKGSRGIWIMPLMIVAGKHYVEG